MKYSATLAAAILAVSGAAASAQVVSEIGNILSNERIADDYGNVVASFTFNNPGSVTTSIITSTRDFRDEVFPGNNGGSLTTDIQSTVSETTTGLAIDGSVDISIGGQNGASGASLAFGSGTAASLTNTSAGFGTLATTAIGSVNDTRMNVSVLGQEIESDAEATAGDAMATADFDTTYGTDSTLLLAGAESLGGIDGSVSVDVAAGSVSGLATDTTAIGAVNASNITASLTSGTAPDFPDAPTVVLP